MASELSQNSRTQSTPPGMNQLRCSGCRTMLMYPSGAPSVVCAVCRSLTSPNPPVIRCTNCATDLTYPPGAPAVMCGVCQQVLYINSDHGRGGLQASSQRRESAKDKKEADVVVVIQNPPTLDETGRYVPNIAMGREIKS